MDSINPIVLVCGFRRAESLSRVLKVATATKLPVIVSLDSSATNEPILKKEIKDVNIILSQFKVFDIWRYDEPLGCKKHLQAAISRAFSLSERVIILEDDTLPSYGFFKFCSEMLEHYSDDAEVGFIAGSRQIPQVVLKGRFRADYPVIWGWATWRRVWDKYDFEMNSFKSESDLVKILPPGLSLGMANWLAYEFNEVKNGKNSWDFQLVWTLLSNKLQSVYPSVNLITNIGLPSAQATNMFDWSHSLFQARFEEEFRRNLPKTRSIIANRWFSDWLIPVRRDEPLIGIRNSSLYEHKNFKNEFKPDFNYYMWKVIRFIQNKLVSYEKSASNR